MLVFWGVVGLEFGQRPGKLTEVVSQLVILI